MAGRLRSGDAGEAGTVDRDGDSALGAVDLQLISGLGYGPQVGDGRFKRGRNRRPVVQDARNLEKKVVTGNCDLRDAAGSVRDEDRLNEPRLVIRDEGDLSKTTDGNPAGEDG